jgi:chromate reductase
MSPFRILAICGSLRARSSNRALLEAAALLDPALEVDLYEGLGTLPHFNPDVEESALPAAAAALRGRVERADALLISTPEYAHGLPGSLKNALDWLVGGHEFVGKPVAVLNASPASEFADAQLRETVRVMSGDLVEAASVALPLRGSGLNAEGIALHPQLGPVLEAALQALRIHVRASPGV